VRHVIRRIKKPRVVWRVFFFARGIAMSRIMPASALSRIGGIADCAGHGTRRVLGYARWEQCPARLIQTERRLDTDDTVRVRRTNHRTISLSTDGERAKMADVAAPEPELEPQGLRSRA